MTHEGIMNKTMERSDLESAVARNIIAELNELAGELRKRGLKTSSWYGCFDLTGDPHSPEVINRGYRYRPLEGAVDDRNFPWFLYWEIAWVAMNAGFMEGQKVLDLGGSSSLFSYYLASKGLDVTTIDLQDGLVRNANIVARGMGWKLSNHVTDMRDIAFNSLFDHIASICVYEHIPMYSRVEINRKIAAMLVPGGRFSITFDYGNPSRHARIETPADVHEQFVGPSGLRVRGKGTFHDTGGRWLLHPFFHPGTSWRYRLGQVAEGHFRPWDLLRRKRRNDYTFGALFLEKP